MNDLFPPAEAAHSAFDEFWERYPRKVGVGAARTKYAVALKKASHDDIMFGLSNQLASMDAKEKQFIPHAATWLHQERWNDEPEEPTVDTGKASDQGRANRFDEARERAIRAAGRGPERGFDLY